MKLVVSDKGVVVGWGSGDDEGVMMMVVKREWEGRGGGGGHDDWCWAMWLKGWRKIQGIACQFLREIQERDKDSPFPFLSLYGENYHETHGASFFMPQLSTSLRKEKDPLLCFFYWKQLSDAHHVFWFRLHPPITQGASKLSPWHCRKKRSFANQELGIKVNDWTLAFGMQESVS